VEDTTTSIIVDVMLIFQHYHTLLYFLYPPPPPPIHQDAVDVRTASAGIGCDEAKMCAVIAGRRPESIRLTDSIYALKYDGASLEKTVRGENVTLLGYLTGGLTDFGKFLTYRTMSQPQVVALLIRKCMTGIGCSDYNLMEILTTSTNADLQAACDHYTTEFSENMVERIASETSGMMKGDYNKWAKALCDFERDETDVVADDIEGLATQLYKAGSAKMMGCDEATFLRILNKANDATCAAIVEAYPTVTDGRNLIKDVKSKMTGDLEFAVVARLMPRYDFLATRVYSACKGIGTDEEALVRILGINDNEECLKLASAYNAYYADQEAPYNDFKALMQSELSGDLLDAIVNLIEVPAPRGHWRDPITYSAAAEADGQSFAEAASIMVQQQRGAAVAVGQTDMFGPLQYFNAGEADAFLIDGCNLNIPTLEPIFVSPIEVNVEEMYNKDWTPAEGETPDQAGADAYLQSIRAKIEEHDNMIIYLTQFIASQLIPQYGSLAYSTRATQHLARQYMQDNAAMLEFCAQRDASNVHEACEGWGTDESTLIDILAALSKPQMKRVNEIYAEKYGKTLSETLDGELSGFFGGSTNFQYFMNCLVNDGATLDAQFLVEAMKGWGTDEKLLTEIVCTRTNAELALAKAKFQQVNGKSVEDWIEGDTSGLYSRFLLKCLEGRRNEDGGAPIVEGVGEGIAAQLWQLGLSGEGDVNEDALLNILAYASIAQIGAAKAAFQTVNGKSLDSAIKDVMGGDVEDAMLIRSMEKAAYFATALNKAWKGWGTDEVATSRILGRFSKNEVRKMMAAYANINDKAHESVKDGIESETSGNYKKALTAYLFTEMPGNEAPESPPVFTR
jgi:hypothetical protein